MNKKFRNHLVSDLLSTLAVDITSLYFLSLSFLFILLSLLFFPPHSYLAIALLDGYIHLVFLDRGRGVPCFNISVDHHIDMCFLSHIMLQITFS